MKPPERAVLWYILGIRRMKGGYVMANKKQTKKKPAVKTEERQQLFIEYYFLTFNGKEAAIRAGYAPSSAEATASRLLRNDNIREKIELHKSRLRERMAEDSNKAYAALWRQIEEIDRKLAKHAEVLQIYDDLQQVTYINGEAHNELMDRIIELKHQLPLPGEEKLPADEEKEIKAEIAQLSREANEYVEVKKVNKREIERLQPYMLRENVIEKYMRLRYEMLSDIMDRGGYKATDKVDLSGSVGVQVSAASAIVTAATNRRMKGTKEDG
jgi:phage terminase small subunit